MKKISDKIYYVGVNDDDKVLFEGLWPIPMGVSYNSYVVVDAFDRGSYIKIDKENNRIIGYTTRNSGGVTRNYKNYFVVEFDKPFDYVNTFVNGELKENVLGSGSG